MRNTKNASQQSENPLSRASQAVRHRRAVILRLRVAVFLVVGGLPYRFCRYTDNGNTRWYVFNDDGVRSNIGTIAYGDGAQEFGTRTDVNSVA